MNILKTAEVAHEVNRAWCTANGDDSQLPWADAPQWQKDSAVMGVEFHMNNPHAPDSASHDSWAKQKIDDGWVYGEVKDPVAKTHHCLVPFHQLAIVDQIKDALFRSTIHAILKPNMGRGVTDVGFNPGANPTITQIKTYSNNLAGLINTLPATRRRAVALTNLETASMWAVKAAACGDD